MVERDPVKIEVGGSNPPGGARYNSAPCCRQGQIQVCICQIQGKNLPPPGTDWYLCQV